MIPFHIGDSSQYIVAEYAKTGRSACKKCKSKIEDKTTRIGILLDDDHFGGCNWYHLECFTLKPRHKILAEQKDLTQKIHSILTLQKKDQTKVLKLFKEELERLNQGKSKKSTVKPELPQSRSKSKSKKKAEQPQKSKSKNKVAQKKNVEVKSKPKQDQKVASKSKAKEDNTKVNEDKSKSKNKSKKQIPKENQKIAKKTSKGIEERQTRGRSMRSNTQKVQVKQKPVEEKKQKKAKSARPAKKSFFTASQQAEFKDFFKDYMTLTTPQLKQILQANNQVKTGTKGDLSERCADGKQLGKTPMCGNCFGGKLRFDRKTATYTCPGYMQDQTFKHCNSRFTFDEIKREKWTQP